MTIQEAAHYLNKSEATIRRYIKQGKLEATLVGGKYSIEESALDAYASSDKHIDNAYPKEALVQAQYLHKQNEELNRQISDQKARIEKLELQLEEERKRGEVADQRHDTIVMQLTRQLENQQKLLEYHESPWWRRWFRKYRNAGQ